MKTTIEEHRFTLKEIIDALHINLKKGDVVQSFNIPPKSKERKLLIKIVKKEAK